LFNLNYFSGEKELDFTDDDQMKNFLTVEEYQDPSFIDSVKDLNEESIENRFNKHFSGEKQFDFTDDDQVKRNFLTLEEYQDPYFIDSVKDLNEESIENRFNKHITSATSDNESSIYIISSTGLENEKLFFIRNVNIASEFFTSNGGSFQFENNMITFSNTCTLDYYLLIWVILSKTNKLLKNIFHRENIDEFYKNINRITQNIVAKKWNSARLVWSKYISKNFLSTTKMITYNYFGSEMDAFSGFHCIQTFKYLFKCTETNCRFGNSWKENRLSGFSIA
jgi:hypothetical protein